MIEKYVFGWIPLVVIAVLNGTLRQYGYGKFVGELTAHQISTVTGIILIGLYVWWLTGKWQIVSAGQAVAIGSIWLGMTVAFEFLFGHFVIGHSWAKLFHDYNLLEGRMWVLVLAWTFVAPLVFYRLRSERPE